MKPLTESVEFHPIGSCVADNIGNSELRDVLKEYFGNNEISYTVDINDEIWAKFCLTSILANWLRKLRWVREK